LSTPRWSAAEVLDGLSIWVAGTLEYAASTTGYAWNRHDRVTAKPRFTRRLS
jgi:hypothetical protein